MCLYLLTSSAFPNIHAQEDKRVTNGNSPFNMASPFNMTLPSSSAGKAFSGTTSPLNNSSDGALSASNSTHFLKYNNLGNNYNKDASTSYNFPEYSGPSSAYGSVCPPPLHILIPTIIIHIHSVLLLIPSHHPITHIHSHRLLFRRQVHQITLYLLLLRLRPFIHHHFFHHPFFHHPVLFS